MKTQRNGLLGFLLFLGICTLHAQEMEWDVMVKERMDEIFEHVDKSRIETGLLSDYGCLLVEPYAYDGTLSDSNYVTTDIWKLLYISMYTARINDKATLEEPQAVFDNLKDSSPALLFLRYNQLDDKAVEKGLLSYENGQIRETGVVGNPYMKKKLFVTTDYPSKRTIS